MKGLLIASRFAAAVLTAGAILAVPVPSLAWQIVSGLTDPCHEMITIASIDGVAGGLFPVDVPDVVDSALFPPRNTAVDPVVAGIADEFAGTMGVTFDSDWSRLVALSLWAGVRYPDILEGSAYDYFVMRPLMLTDKHEDRHFLRRSFDDGTEGDLSAIAAGRARIDAETGAAIEAAALPLPDRFVTHRVAVDFYGEVDVELYEPLYRLGTGLHTFEDSFSHAIRTDDLRGILTVLNSIDAVSDDFLESRDGIAHSMAMDRCMDDAAAIAPIAAAATREVMAAVSLEVDSPGVGEINGVLDKWLEYVPGCSFDNNYCDATWLEVARRDPFEPFIPMVLGCGAMPSGNIWALMILLLPFLALVSRRSR